MAQRNAPRQDRQTAVQGRLLALPGKSQTILAGTGTGIYRYRLSSFH